MQRELPLVPGTHTPLAVQLLPSCSIHPTNLLTPHAQEIGSGHTTSSDVGIAEGRTLIHTNEKHIQLLLHATSAIGSRWSILCVFISCIASNPYNQSQTAFYHQPKHH